MILYCLSLYSVTYFRCTGCIPTPVRVCGYFCLLGSLSGLLFSSASYSQEEEFLLHCLSWCMCTACGGELMHLGTRWSLCRFRTAVGPVWGIACNGVSSSLPGVLLFHFQLLDHMVVFYSLLLRCGARCYLFSYIWCIARVRG